MIEVRNLSKSFPGVSVLHDVNVIFREGCCNMIIGKSGSGKTVLLKNLIGLLKPDGGDIIYDGDSLMAMSVEEMKLLHQKVGVLFQGSALFDFANVIDNVMFPMNFFTDWSRNRKIERARFCLEKVGVLDAEYKMPSELSGGMQKRVGIARAIALNPKYLFCDEPNSGLDPYTSILIDRLISSLTREFNMTTVINTHDLNSMLQIGDDISFISGGTIAWQGGRDNILKTDSEDLVEFICANTLAKGVMENPGR